MGVNSLPKTVTRQRRDCDLNPGPSVPESSTLTTRLPSHPSPPLFHLRLHAPDNHRSSDAVCRRRWRSKLGRLVLFSSYAVNFPREACVLSHVFSGVATLRTAIHLLLTYLLTLS